MIIMEIKVNDTLDSEQTMFTPIMAMEQSIIKMCSHRVLAMSMENLCIEVSY